MGCMFWIIVMLKSKVISVFPSRRRDVRSFSESERAVLGQLLKASRCLVASLIKNRSSRTAVLRGRPDPDFLSPLYLFLKRE